MTLLFTRLLLLLTLIDPALRAAAADHPPEIEELPSWTLTPGETRTLPAPALEKFTVSGKSVRAVPLPAETTPSPALLFKALESGTSEVWVFQKKLPTLHLTVRVTPPAKSSGSSASFTPSPLDSSLELLREARVLRAGDRIQLQGMVVTESELARIRLLQDTFPKLVDDLTTTSPELLSTGRLRLRTALQELKLEAQLRLEELGGRLWIRGSAPDGPTKTSWEQKLAATFPGARFDISSLSEPARTLFFRIFLLEVKKSAFRQLGLNWPSHLAGSLAVEAGSLVWTGFPQLDLALQWLEGKGFARVLSQPELVVKVPGEAELFAGGEIPLEIHSRSGPRMGAWIDWKPYGLTLKLKALQSAGEQVRLEISSEISELDRANGSGDLPGIQASRLRTQVDARIGEPLFLSGLLQEKSGTQQRGLPWLAKIPVLGKLFGSEDYIQQRSELVAVLLPLHAPPPAAGKLTPFEAPDVPPLQNPEPSLNRNHYIPPKLAR